MALRIDTLRSYGTPMVLDDPSLYTSSTSPSGPISTRPSIRAGIPKAMLPAGNDRFTIAPAPTKQPSPISIPRVTIAFGPR
jgi:hypothetical protein